jgi:hypothetical protein
MMQATELAGDDLASLGIEEPELVLHPRQLSVEEDQAKYLAVRTEVPICW